MACPVLNAFVDDGGDEIVIIEQAENGIRERRIPAQYTSYHRTSDISRELMRKLKRADQVAHVANDGETWIRVGWKTEIWRRQARWKLKDEGIETYEGDVDPVRWWLTESKIAIARPRRCYLDIETDSRVSFSKKEEMRILCWTISDDRGPLARGVLEQDDDDDEARLLTEMWKVLENFDQVCAWYGGDPEKKDNGFDFYVIVTRSRRCGLTVDTRRWLWLDQLVVWRRMNQAESGDEKESMKLEDIAQHQIGEGKEQSPPWVVERFGTKGLGALAWDLWAAGGKFRQLLVDYCAKDTELLRKLEDRKKFITLFQTLCEVCSVFGNTNGLFPTGQMDGFLLRLGRQENYRFPTKKYYDENKREKFEGAFVLAPRTVPSSDGRWTKEDAKEWRESRGMTNGILRNVHVCDFASLYPSNIITWNLSEETKVVDEETIERCYNAFKNGEPMPVGICRSPGTGLFTYTNKPGILPLALRVMLQMRKKYADEAAKYPPGTPEFIDAMARSTAYKVAANSFYGVVGASTSRYFDKMLAESTTQNGVWLIKRVMAQGEKRKIESVAGDTDSAFTIGPTRDGFNTFIKWLNDKDLPQAIAATGVKAEDNFVKLAYEKAFDILVFSAKKKYCNPPEAPIWMADMSFKKLSDVRVGDLVVGWVKGKKGSKVQKRTLVRSRVVAIQSRQAPIVKITMGSGKVIRCTADHRWLSFFSRQNSEYVLPKLGRTLAHIVEVPKELTTEERIEASWLGGIWDGEGSLNGGGRGQITIAQSRRKNPEVCDRIEQVLAQLGFDYHSWEQNKGACIVYALRGSRQAKLNFAAWCKPSKIKRLLPAVLKSRFANPDIIVSIEPDVTGEVISMTTTTGNYVAWGYASKNCGRYNHYKWKTTCTRCKTKKGSPGSVDVRTLICEDCKYQYTEQPTFIGKPEIKGLEYRRGDTSRIGREMQGKIIDLLVGGLHTNPGIPDDLERPVLDLSYYTRIIEETRERVMSGPLTVEDVRQSKGINKDSLKEYVTKTKADGEEGAQAPHVLVARILESRGQSVSKGTRIEFVTVDGDCSPMKVIPAEDFNGECDRYYLWDTLIYPPTQRLLEGAFPNVDWEKWGDIRPKKAKGTNKVSEFQLGFDLSPKPNGKSPSHRCDVSDLAVPTFSSKALIVPIPEEAGADAIERVQAVLKSNPGARTVEIHILLRSGSRSTLKSPLRVATGPKLATEIAAAIAYEPSAS